MIKHLIFLLLLVTLTSAFSQSSDNIPTGTNIVRSKKSVVYHNENNQLPDTLIVRGTINQILYGYCGYICMGGVVEVKLTQSLHNYPFNYAYLVTACLENGITCGQKIVVNASKLTGTEKECYYQNVSGGIDSKGVPFYKLSESETKKIN
ncbi:hypothetical protein QNI16_21485 [Cytophagaceae bacterium YF14B1]|uniref:Secreted protein n=1 Tax=Xanthocytophaga flava TaxID=3048013 RepID=A0AAE3QTR9_9BACT|nr:hypothetical protein [Xanthocytophaga flavus]MDJ1483086.1 hypothetical protein [Xanthocytophaga flavus]